MIKVHVLQVSAKLPEEVTRLRRYLAAGRTRDGHWQSIKIAGIGDIAIGYKAGCQAYTAWGLGVRAFWAHELWLIRCR